MSRVWIINQYASTPETGIGGRHHYLASALAKQGHDVYLIGARWHHLLLDDAIAAAAPAVEKRDDYTFVRVDVPTYSHAQAPRRILNWLLFSWRLRHLPKTLPEAPDTILYSSPSLLGFQGASALAKKRRARLVFEVRDIWPLTLQEIGGHSAGHPLIRFMQYVEDRAYRISDAVMSNLPNANKHMIERGMDAHKFTWVPNGFSIEEVANPIPLDADTQALLPKGKFIVGYTGTMGAANALTTVVDAADILKDRTDIAFVLVGHGREQVTLVESVAARGLTNVHVLAPISKSHVPSMLAEFDACYIGLTRDPLFRFGVSPNKLFDYLVAAKPIIYGIDSGDYRPVVDFGAGIQIPPEDAQALADAAILMADTPLTDRNAMGARGRQAAFATYAYSILAQRLEKVLFPTKT